MAVGALYAIGGLVVLIMLAVNVWNAAKIVDVILQAMLVMSAVCGVWFVFIALRNLGVRFAGRRMPHLVRRTTAH
jgi:hypothetical protein